MKLGNKNYCSGCGSCKQICPQNAISMVSDRFGFSYPKIDHKKCINCNLCIQKCPFLAHNEFNYPIKTFAANNLDLNILNHSSSGGVFSALAGYIIDNDGIVFGSTLYCENNIFYHKHIGITKKNDLKLLQGSKYIQSDLGDVYTVVEQKLKIKKPVLFCGTPCQVAGLKHFLRIDYKSLFLVDLICHGVPSISLFNSYINLISKKEDIEIIDYKFRDKTEGWGLHGAYLYLKNSKQYKNQFPCYSSSFYSLFLKGLIYRNVCYHCIFARKERISDITLGDYWGYDKSNKFTPPIVNSRLGVSCVLVNTNKGLKLYKSIQHLINSCETEYPSIYKYNLQLIKPSRKSFIRLPLLFLESIFGYFSIEIMHSIFLFFHEIKRISRKK